VIDRSKGLGVLVETLTGRLTTSLPAASRPGWTDLRANRRHARTGTRPGASACGRTPPGARRLKLWRLPDGDIEFDFFAHHDAGLDCR